MYGAYLALFVKFAADRFIFKKFEKNAIVKALGGNNQCRNQNLRF